jgi:hypothetical protein
MNKKSTNISVDAQRNINRAINDVIRYGMPQPMGTGNMGLDAIITTLGTAFGNIKFNNKKNLKESLISNLINNFYPAIPIGESGSIRPFLNQPFMEGFDPLTNYQYSDSPPVMNDFGITYTYNLK